MHPSLHEASSHRTVALFGVEFAFRLETANTDGRAAALEVTIPPRTLVKPHQHSKEDEFSLVLSGPIGVRVGDQTVEEVPTGSWLAKPRSVPHAIWNVTDAPARILEVVTPAGLEEYFEKIAPVLREHGPEWTERFYELATEYGLTVLDDWSDELKATYGITL